MYNVCTEYLRSFYCLGYSGMHSGHAASLLFVTHKSSRVEYCTYQSNSLNYRSIKQRQNRKTTLDYRTVPEPSHIAIGAALYVLN